jgi:iron complex transport system substrate-binding protein
MRSRSRAAVAAFLMAFVSAPAAAQGQQATQTVVDDMGRSVTVPLPITRAAVFNLYNVEFFRAVGGIDVVVGIDRGPLGSPGYFPSFSEANVVGQGQAAPNYEAIVAADPDVVIFPRNGAWEEATQQLAPFGIPVMVITGWDTLDHAENLRLVGQLVGEEERAEEVVEFYEHYMELLDERLAGVEPRTVYLEKVPSLYTAIPGSGWHDMIIEGGGINIFGDVDITQQPANRGTVHQFQVDPETIVAADPAVIVKLALGDAIYPPAEPGVLADLANEILMRPGWSSIDAIENNEVYAITSFSAGISSKMVGALHIAKALYPDLFEDLDIDEVIRIWLEEFQGVPFETGYFYPAAPASED